VVKIFTEELWKNPRQRILSDYYQPINALRRHGYVLSFELP